MKPADREEFLKTSTKMAAQFRRQQQARNYRESLNAFSDWLDSYQKLQQIGRSPRRFRIGTRRRSPGLVREEKQVSRRKRFDILKWAREKILRQHEAELDNGEAEFLLRIANEREAERHAWTRIGIATGRQIERDVALHNRWLERGIVFFFGWITGFALALWITARILKP